MKIIFCSYDDYSNYAFSLSESLKSVGVNSQSICLVPHPFQYVKSSIVVTRMMMIEQMEAADIIIIAHSFPSILEMCKHMGKRLFVIHTGTSYRQNPTGMNEIFNPVCERILFDSPEFDLLIGKERNYVAGAIDTDLIKFSHHKNTELTFAHYPNKPETKGTVKIQEMMRDFPVKFLCDTTEVSHEENMKRISECDVYIELFAPKQRDKTYGSFGMTAFEAAAMGKIVITNSMYQQLYFDSYGESALLIANNEARFKEQVQFCINSNIIDALKGFTHNWIVEKHSYKSTGNYLIKVLNL